MIHEFSRTEMLIGREGLARLAKSTVFVCGIGGVGSFVVEGLARAGVGSLVLVDHDTICTTNINRQIHAIHDTIGGYKVEVMKERVKRINPNATVTIFPELYNAESAPRLVLSHYSYVVDAIDMVSSKLLLVEQAVALQVPVISSMGTGNKMNPALLEVADIYETSVCPLARVMRKELRKRSIEHLKVVYSREEPIKPLEDHPMEGEQVAAPQKKAPGSISFVPSVAGLLIASEVVKDLLCEEKDY